MINNAFIKFSGIIVMTGILVMTGIPFAAGIDLDSLKLAVINQKDSREKVDNLYTIARTYYYSRILDSLQKYADDVFILASEIDYREKMVDALFLKSNVQESRGELNHAYATISQYLEIAGTLDDKIRLARGNYAFARIINMQGQKDLATRYLKENIKLGAELSDTLLLLASLNELGNIYQDLNVLDSAVHYYLESARLCENSSREAHLGRIYNNLGKTFTRLKQYPEAKAYLISSLEFNRAREDNETVFTNLLNLGYIYLFQVKPDSALIYFDQAAELSSIYPDTSLFRADLYNSYAETYELLEKYNLALEYLQKAYKIYVLENYPDGMAVTLVNMGNIYTNLKQFSQAEEVIDSSYRVSKRAGSKINQKGALWAMADNYYKTGNYKSAYDYYVRFHTIYDTILEAERTSKINELNIRYNKEKLDKENLELKNRNLEMELDLRKKSYQSNVYLFTGLVLVIIAILLALYFRQRSIISKQRIRQLEEEKKLLGARLLLEGQEQERKRIATELHDGLGVLLSATKMQFSSLRLSLPENKELLDRAMQLLEQASGDVRKISHNMMPGLLTKMGLYDAVEDLFENIHDKESLQTKVEIPQDLKRPKENTEIMLYRIIQEWVNNTLKHSGAKNIHISMHLQNEQLWIEYEDDGAGFDVEEILGSEKKSMGIKSIQSRVDFLNGTLQLNSAPGKGVQYRLRIPV